MNDFIKSYIVGICSLYILSASAHLQADVTFDNTVPGSGTLTGAMVIESDKGVVSGTNLFHSFSEFNITTGQSATFIESASSTVTFTNVISRVTGSGTTTIDGLLSSTVDSANFYFINPNGITFGTNASVNVPAAFHVSGAEQLNFSNGDKYSAVDTSGSTFSSATPESFGFLGAAGNITWLPHIDRARNTFSVSGADITVRGRMDNEGPTTNTFVAAVGNSVSTLNLSTGAVTGGANGELKVWGRDIPDNPSWADANDNFARISANNKTYADGGSVVVTAGDISMIDGTISANTYHVGDGGDITITANNLTMSGKNQWGTAIRTATYPRLNSNPGDGGTITLNIANHILMNSYAIIDANVYQENKVSNAANAGDIFINASSLTMMVDEGVEALNHLRISSSLLRNTSGLGGKVDLKISGDLVVSGGAYISTDTQGTGQGGGVDISAGSLLIDGTASRVSADTTLGSKGNGGQGNAGSVTIKADEVQVINGGQISSKTETASTGSAGGVSVTTDNLIVSSGSSISTTTLGSGNAGAVTVNATDFLLTGDGTKVSSAATGNYGADSGSISLKGVNYIQTSGAKVTTESESGADGNITLKFRDLINITDSALTTSVYGGASGGGDIDIDPIAIVFNNATIQANATTGNGGNIQIVGDYIIFDSYRPSVIEASSQSGIDGTIETDAADGNSAGTISVLKTDFLKANEVLNNVCAAQRAGNVNSLAIDKNVTRSASPTAILPALYQGATSAISIPTNMHVSTSCYTSAVM